MASLLLMAACGGSNGSGGSDAAEASGFDCDGIEAATTVLDGSLLVLVGMGNYQQYERIRAGELDYDPEALASAINDLRPLEQVELPSDLFGEVADGLDRYERVNDLAAEELAEGRLAEAQNPELLELTADAASFFDGKGAVGLAAATIGCEVFD